MAVGSWVTWFFSSWDRKKCLPSRSNSQNDNFFHSKRPPRTILSESSHFVHLISFARSSFFLSMKKITWLNSQQHKTRGHVEDLCWWWRWKFKKKMSKITNNSLGKSKFIPLNISPYCAKYSLWPLTCPLREKKKLSIRFSFLCYLIFYCFSK